MTNEEYYEMTNEEGVKVFTWFLWISEQRLGGVPGALAVTTLGRYKAPSDLTLFSDGVQHRVHQQIVCRQSSVIKRLADLDSNETDYKVFEVIFDEMPLFAWIHFMYSGSYDLPPKTSVLKHLKVYQIAEWYDVQPLILATMDKMEACIVAEGAEEKGTEQKGEFAELYDEVCSNEGEDIRLLELLADIAYERPDLLPVDVDSVCEHFWPVYRSCLMSKRNDQRWPPSFLP